MLGQGCIIATGAIDYPAEYHGSAEETRAILDMAMSLEGLVRNAGMHAGGVVISPSVP